MLRSEPAESLCFGSVNPLSVDVVENVRMRDAAHLKREERIIMTATQQGTRDDGANRIIESVQDAEQSALEAVRKFIDAVDGVFPDVSEDGPRRKIIDSAFKMTEQLVGASNQLAQKFMKVAGDALGELERSTTASKK